MKTVYETGHRLQVAESSVLNCFCDHFCLLFAKVIFNLADKRRDVLFETIQTSVRV